MSGDLREALLAAQPWLVLAGDCLLAALIALVAYRVSDRVLTRWAAPHLNAFAAALLRHLRAPMRWVFIFFALQVVLREADDALRGVATLTHLTSLCLLGALTLAATQIVAAAGDAILQAHPVGGEDNLNARRIQTQTRVLSRTLTGVILLIGVAAALMTFPSVRQFGAGLMASAGVAGLVVGFAAKPVLGNLLAGMQIALAQPIRLDDVVIVEGEWGRIEEIAGSYVVVALWDERRLIVPLQWFIEHPFQNWTRSTSQLLGTVFLWVDYRLPLAPLRAEAERLCRAAPAWDQRVCVIQVTDANERAMQLRVLVSSADSGRNFDLRCKLREGLIEFVGQHYPDGLPRLRADLTVEPAEPLPARPMPA